jgi:hypothetical protein
MVLVVAAAVVVNVVHFGKASTTKGRRRDRRLPNQVQRRKQTKQHFLSQSMHRVKTQP